MNEKINEVIEVIERNVLSKTLYKREGIMRGSHGKNAIVEFADNLGVFVHIPTSKVLKKGEDVTINHRKGLITKNSLYKLS